jgi:hypothetical protein
MITLSDFARRTLYLWAKLHDKPRATYASQIVEARCEANYEMIVRLIEGEARRRGQTGDELIEEWLAEDEGDESAY